MDNSGINIYSIVYGHGGLIIGDDVRIAGNATIIPANHNYDNTKIVIRKQGEEKREGFELVIILGLELAV